MQTLQPGDPRQVGRYLLLARLGSGGMGRVFLGQSPGGRMVAVKLIRPALAGEASFRARFAREVAAARKVGGMFTAAVVDADPDAHEPWLVTAYVDGPSLADAVSSQGPLPSPAVLTLAAGLAEGLGAIHAAGMVHRDLKPSNVLLASDGPRIIDFGISRALDATALTRGDLVIGSPGFMSPEQAQGRPVGPPSDIFSLGGVLTFAATSEGPFGTGTSAAVLYRVVYRPPATAGLATAIRPLVERCLAKDPQQRPTTDEILAELGGVRAGPDWLPWAADARLPGHTAPTLATPWAPGVEPAATPWAAGAEGGAQPPAPRPRRRGWAWVAAGAAALIVIIGAGAAAVASHWWAGTGSGRPGPASPVAAGTPPTQAAPPAPSTVVRAYFAAINRHDWARVWDLGGKNLSQSFPAMVAGYSQTSRDVVTALTARGNTVTVRILAYQTDGSVQSYQLSYVVKDGVITGGHGTLLGSGG